MLNTISRHLFSWQYLFHLINYFDKEEAKLIRRQVCICVNKEAFVVR